MIGLKLTVFFLQIGFEMDEHLDEDNTVQQTNDYQPLEDPKNSTSRKLDININRITGNLTCMVGKF